MLRRREIAASPARRADEAWTAVVELIADTLDRSTNIERSEVVEALSGLTAVGPRLVAGRHLEKIPVVLAADQVRLSIFTVSGAEAMNLEENLAPVPGGTSATTWKVYVPAPDPLAAEVAAAVAGVGSTCITAEPPPDAVVKAAQTADIFDLDALARRLKGDRS